MNEIFLRRRLMAKKGKIKRITSDMITYGYGAADQSPPPSMQTRADRAIYAPFDILIPPNCKLTINTTADTNDIYFAVRFFSFAQLNNVNNNIAPGDPPYYDTGWLKDSYEVRLPIINKPNIAGFRIVFSKGSSHNQTINSSANITVTIKIQ